MRNGFKEKYHNTDGNVSIVVFFVFPRYLYACSQLSFDRIVSYL